MTSRVELSSHKQDFAGRGGGKQEACLSQPRCCDPSPYIHYTLPSLSPGPISQRLNTQSLPPGRLGPLGSNPTPNAVAFSSAQCSSPVSPTHRLPDHAWCGADFPLCSAADTAWPLLVPQREVESSESQGAGELRPLPGSAAAVRGTFTQNRAL